MRQILIVEPILVLAVPDRLVSGQNSCSNHQSTLMTPSLLANIQGRNEIGEVNSLIEDVMKP